MEVIADELKKNALNIDIETISEHINYILNNYRDVSSRIPVEYCDKSRAKGLSRGIGGHSAWGPRT